MGGHVCMHAHACLTARVSAALAKDVERLALAPLDLDVYLWSE